MNRDTEHLHSYNQKAQTIRYTEQKSASNKKQKENIKSFKTINRTLTKGYHDNGCKGSLNKSHRLNITQSMFSNHNTMTSEVKTK